MDAAARVVQRVNVVSRFKQADARVLPWEGKFVGKDVRLSWTAHSWTLEELPQKGKKRLRKGYLQNPRGPARGLDWYISDNILMLAKLSTSDDYDKIKDKILKAYGEAADKVEAEPKSNPYDVESLKWIRQLKWSEDQVSYLTVVPEGVDPIRVKGKDFEFTSKWTSFTIYSPSSDFNQADAFYTGLEQASPTAARKLYNIVKTDPNALKSVGYHDLDKWMAKNGIKTKYISSSWR